MTILLSCPPDATSIAAVLARDLRRRIYVKAKAEKSWRFWGLYVHLCKMQTLREADTLAKENDGAPGVDGVTFEAIEKQGVDGFLEQIRDRHTRADAIESDRFRLFGRNRQSRCDRDRRPSDVDGLSTFRVVRNP
jgi:hypothetical protein